MALPPKLSFEHIVRKRILSKKFEKLNAVSKITILSQIIIMILKHINRICSQSFSAQSVFRTGTKQLQEEWMQLRR